MRVLWRAGQGAVLADEACVCWRPPGPPWGEVAQDGTAQRTLVGAAHTPNLQSLHGSGGAVQLLLGLCTELTMPFN